MPRSTTNVRELVSYANSQLARTDQFVNAEFRNGIINMVENILFSADQYAGFRYLTNDELPADVLPGVRYSGNDILPFPERFDNTDTSRRFYFLKK